MVNESAKPGKDDAAVERAVGWVLWCVKKTPIPFGALLRSAKRKFGIPMARIERAVRDRLPAQTLADRGSRIGWEKMPKSHKKAIADRAKERANIAAMDRAAKRHLRNM